MTLAAARAADRPGALSHLRALGVAVGPAGAASYAGRLRVTGPAGMAGLHAGARVSSLSPGGGSYGVFLPGVPAGDEATAEGVVTGLRAEADVRSNVAFVHAGGAGSGPVTLELQLFDGEAGGSPAGSPTTVRLDEGLLAPASRPSPPSRREERLGAGPEDGGERTLDRLRRPERRRTSRGSGRETARTSRH